MSGKGVSSEHSAFSFNRVEETLRLNEERLEAILALHNMTGASEHELTHFAMEAAVRLTGSAIGYIAFVNEDETVMTMSAWSGETMRQCGTADRPIKYPVATAGLWGEAIRQRRTIITNDYAAPNQSKRGTPEGHVSLTRHVTMPTFDGGRIVVVAGVGNKQTDYGDDDVRQLSLLMQGLWSIIRSKRAEEILRSREERLRNQNAVLLSLVSHGALFQADLNQAIAEITEASSALIRAERVSVWRFDADCAAIRCIDLYRRSTRRHSSGETLRSEAFPSYMASHRKGEVLAAADVHADPRTRDIPAAYYEEHDIRSLLDAPVWLHDRLGAILSFEHTGERRVWTLEDESLAADMATLLSLCFEAGERRQTQTALQKSESRLADAVKIAKLGHWELDVESGVFTFTDSLYDVYHTTAKDVGGYQIPLAEYVDHFVHPEDAALVTEEMRQALETDDPQFSRYLEHRVLYADGGVGCIAVRYFVVKDSQGRTVRTYGVNQDVTERERGEEALRKSEEQFRTLFEYAPYSCAVCDLEGRYLMVNRACRRDNGLEADDMIGRTAEELGVEAVPESREKALAELAASGTIHSLEMDLNRGGRRLTILLSAQTIEFAGRPAQLFMTVDITDRKRTEALLSQSEEKHRVLFESSPDAIFMIKDERIVDCNPSALEQFACTREQLLGRSPGELAPPEQPGGGSSMELARQHMRRVRAGQSHTFEWQHARFDGSEFTSEISLTMMRLLNETYLVAFMRDITVRRQMQSLMVQTEKMQSLGGLAAGMAHEINNPLGVIVQAAQNVQLRMDPAREANIEAARRHGLDLYSLDAYLRERNILRYLSGIREAGERAATIVADMLSFSRRSEGFFSANDLNAIADRALDLAGKDYDLRKQYDFRRVEIVREFCPDLPLVPCVASEIEQVLLNLLRNAAQAMFEARVEWPAITVRTMRKGEWGVLEVEDNGPGIPKEHLAHVFEPFFTTKKVGEGTGLGLSVSYFIITQNHRGRFSVASPPGGGARFQIALPLRQ